MALRGLRGSITLLFRHGPPSPSRSGDIYTSKGIPIALFFTGPHPDHHANSDGVEKILFGKQARIAQLGSSLLSE